ncbi:MFS transporter [Parathalassolituus penaei]|mgnify:CR=1 FL=1|uniref:MFS transporter n=1 Tax=Parathalassolituus penaei TaxID=2997323 RepID=A0A9X3EEP3_9GAMM|nr:MFS transporter [Parathalassolituus penaei]MCY0965846.1 MFS transporter [Parathalassolituus penaei]
MSEFSPAFPKSRLSLFYALFFALTGCIMPFWGLYLQHLGFGADEIGALIASFSGVRIFAPNVWAWFGQRLDSPLQMVRAAGVLTAICFSAIWIADGFWQVLGVMALYGFFWSATLPQYEVLTMRLINNCLEQYSRIRLWGSIGFVVAVVVIGWLLDYISIRWLPVVMLLLMLGILLNSFGIPDQRRERKLSHARLSIFPLLKEPAVLAFIAVNFLLQVSHGPYYTFFSIYMQELQYSGAAIGGLWALGVIAEVVLFWKIGFFLRQASLRRWLLLSLVLTSVRWSMVALFPDSLLLMLVAQLFHAFSFAMLHAVCIRYVPVLFPDSLQGQGQALYSSVGFGLGGALGAWGSGHLWALGGLPVFMLAAGASVLALLVAWAGLKNVATT